MSNFKISARNILEQLKADAIGKDSQRGVTLTYAWLANQVGHFSLGFIPTVLVFKWLNKLEYFDEPAFVTGLFVSLFWLLFETYNFLGPLLAGKKSSAQLVYVPSKEKTIFKPAWGNVAFDTITDLIFFWIGAFTASYILSPNMKVGCIIGFYLLSVIFPTRYWFLTKMYLQNTYYPFQFRLSQWTFGIEPTSKQKVDEFLDKNSSVNHLLIFGGQNKGKTSLGVALATELSIKHEACMYMTATKLYTSYHENKGEKIRISDLWTWQNCSVLVVDDVNPGKPIDEIITPKKFKQWIESFPPNKEKILQKKTIWILGETESTENLVNNWEQTFQNLGFEASTMKTIVL